MSTSRPSRLPRRVVLSVPVVAAAAVTLAAQPAQAAPSKANAPECLADLLGGS